MVAHLHGPISTLRLGRNARGFVDISANREVDETIFVLVISVKHCLIPSPATRDHLSRPADRYGGELLCLLEMCR